MLLRLPPFCLGAALPLCYSDGFPLEGRRNFIPQILKWKNCSGGGGGCGSDGRGVH